MARILIPLLVSLTFACLARGDAASPQANDPKYRLPLEAVPTHYKLDLKLDMKDYTFSGIVQVNITAAYNSETITLNAKNLTINSVLMISNKLSKEQNLTKTTYLDEKYEIMTVKLQEKIVQNQTYVLKIAYNGTLSDQLRGFYKSRSTRKNGTSTYVAATHFEPTGARLAFPCWDEPAIKAPFEITIVNSGGNEIRAISNMKEIDNKVNGDLRTTTFDVTPKISTYLVAFVVADYDYTEDNSTEILYRVWTKPQSINQTKYALKVGRELLEEMGKYTDISFKDYVPKMDQVSLRDFSAGAMENWGLVTYRESALLAEEGVSSVRALQRVTTIIAHEFAHQWFGNLVSPKWWTYIWLNEGFADYFEYFLTHKIKPEWRLDDVFVVNNIQGTAFTADVVENQRPMNHEVNTPQEISSLFDNIAYQKSGSVIRMMSHILGEEAFQNGLRRYLSNNKLKAADSNTLLKDLGNGTKYNEVLFEEIMNEWVNKPGYPVVSVKKVNNTFELRQQQFTLYETKLNDTKWWVPITYVTTKNVTSTNTYPSRWLSPNQEKLDIPVSDGEDWIIVNVKQIGYYRVNYEPAVWELLAERLNSNYTSVHPTNRAQLIDDALNMARSNQLNYTTALQLTTFLSKEKDYVVWQAVFRNLQFLHNLIRTSAHYPMFQEYVGIILTTVTSEVNYEPKKNETDLEKLLRVNAIEWACRAHVTQCTDYATRQFNAWLNDTNTKFDDDLRNNLLCAGIRNASDSEWDKARSLILKIKDEEEKLALYPLLACSQSEDILEQFLKQSLEQNATLSFSDAASQVVSRHPQGANIALKALVVNYPDIKSRKNGNQVIVSTVNAIAGGVTTVKQYMQLNKILAGLEDVKVESFKSVITKASRNLQWLELHQNDVENWMHDFSSASSFTFASFLLVLSILVTRFY
ncbi:hypothetical protein K0M31_010391 [Melipona bicolor]|uniref:Aminopeptidase n=1 Tax=Melipona bicolor TaxID=60889 RepID=A0AA40KIJ5_9HYME|nr:hypothetical protein K0M31_010391 [Melipona bicolor]